MSAASGERRPWRVLDLLRWTADYFASKGIDTARLDAEVLLAFALGTDRLRLYLDFDKPVEPAERARFRELVRRRAEERVPVALLTGHREFWSLPLRVSGDVLIPRPETETLVESALALLPDPEADVSVLDLGTGSGAVALAIARERPKARITATDCSEAALRIARSNGAALGLEERLCWLAGYGFAPVMGRRFDLVVSNPPYVGEDEAPGLAPELAHEPREALFAGPDGTAMLRRIAREAPTVLSAGGGLAVELAPQQAPDVAEWLRQAGFENVSTRRDLGGRPRVVTGCWPGGRD